MKACACCNSFFIDKSHVNQATLCTFKKYSLRWLKTPKVKHKSLRLLANHGITIIIANTKILLRIVTGEAACMSESRLICQWNGPWEFTRTDNSPPCKCLLLLSFLQRCHLLNMEITRSIFEGFDRQKDRFGSYRIKVKMWKVSSSPSFYSLLG